MTVRCRTLTLAAAVALAGLAAGLPAGAAPGAAAPTTIVCGVPQALTVRPASCLVSSHPLLSPVCRPVPCNVDPGPPIVLRFARLRWTGWGRPIATASGLLLEGSRRPYRRVPVAIQVSGLRSNCAAGRGYTRLRLTSARGSERHAIYACP
jgi:hypothetical protein